MCFLCQCAIHFGGLVQVGSCVLCGRTAGPAVMLACVREDGRTGGLDAGYSSPFLQDSVLLAHHGLSPLSATSCVSSNNSTHHPGSLCMCSASWIQEFEDDLHVKLSPPSHIIIIIIRPDCLYPPDCKLITISALLLGFRARLSAGGSKSCGPPGPGHL